MAEMKGLSDSHLRHVGAMGPFRCVRFKLRQMACFHQLTPRTLQSQIANALSTLQHQHKNKTPTMGRLIISGGDEGIRTLDTLASILHFQCSALDQLCDISGSEKSYSSSIDTSDSITSSITSAASAIGASSANAFSNSASISRNNGSSVPISKDSSTSAIAGVSL